MFGVVSNVAQVGTRLITVPIVIHHLGLDGYGIWNVIVMTATYMRFGSVGVKTAFQKYVAEATGNGDYDGASRLLSTGCIIMLLLSTAGLVPVMLFSHKIAIAAGVPQQFLASSQGAIAWLALVMLMANVGAAFESIVMGGHRIDLVRKFSTVLTVVEAVAIVVVLHFGFGLLAMAGIMGASELLYISCCYLASHRVVPQIRISLRHFSTGVLYELFRFAGSYQLVNLLEVLYASLLPVAILKTFGATPAGVYAVVVRVVASAAILQEAFLPPVLSGGTMVYASGNPERMHALLTKAFKITLVLSLFPLSFIAAFGPTMAYAWTGQSDPTFRTAFWLVSLKAVFAAVSILALVLYRVSGKALLDNVRQVLRILIILGVVVYAHRLGFYGVLAGMAIAELMGMLFMLSALTRTFHAFRTRWLVPDAIRMIAAAAVIIGIGALASQIPIAGDLAGRKFATLKLGEITLACALVTWPILVGIGAVTADDKAALFSAVFPRKPIKKMMQEASR